jgi:hypothetical protein
MTSFEPVCKPVDMPAVIVVNNARLPAVIQQAKIDRATCIGEATNTEAGTPLRSKGQFEDVYDACMAKRGYARQ